MSEKKTITVKLPTKVADEFESVAKQIGFETSEQLLKTYIREVIISTRVEQATASLRETIARGSSDLDELATERKVSDAPQQ